MHWKIGSAPVGGIIEVVEFDEAGDLAWVSITGVNLRGRFRLRDAGPDGTRVTFRLSYQAPGGLLGLIADRIAGRQVGRVLQQSLCERARHGGAVKCGFRCFAPPKMPIPDPGFPLQLVHHDDVAAAIALAATTDAPPGAYNIAGDGEVSLSQVVTALGGQPVRVPAIAATVASAVIAHTPFVPSALEWLHIARTSVVMDTSKAQTQLGWKPKYTSAETLQALAQAV